MIQVQRQDFNGKVITVRAHDTRAIAVMLDVPVAEADLVTLTGQFTDVAAGWSKQLNAIFGFIPIFENNSDNFLRSPFIAGLVVTVMIVPIIASITREIFSQMDRDVINASLALGGNRESTLRKVILPTAGGGVVESAPTRARHGGGHCRVARALSAIAGGGRRAGAGRRAGRARGRR